MGAQGGRVDRGQCCRHERNIELGRHVVNMARGKPRVGWRNGSAGPDHKSPRTRRASGDVPLKQMRMSLQTPEASLQQHYDEKRKSQHYDVAEVVFDLVDVGLGERYCRSGVGIPMPDGYAAAKRQERRRT